MTRLRASIAERGDALLILPGGRSPIGLLRRLADEDLPWEQVTVTVTDERLVARDDPEWTLGALLSHMGGAGRRVRAVPLAEQADHPDPLAFAATAAAALPWPATVTILGVGPDGHTASLFPGRGWGGTPPESRVFLIEDSPKPPPRRVSLSADALGDADALVMLAYGEDKRPAVDAALAGDAGSPLTLFLSGARPAILWRAP